MLTDLLQGDRTLNAWGMVGAVGFLFFLVQAGLCLSFCRRLRRQEQVLRRSFRMYEAGKNGRSEDGTEIDRTSWHGWIVSLFPADANRESGHFTREDALQELDARIASDGGYLLLQRMGVMAPLLGVVLTVAGFFWLHVDANEQSLQGILMAVTPLVSGVGVGAVLALINQVLLHVAGRRVESLRLLGRTWFDTVIWRNVNGGNPIAAVSSTQVMEDFLRGALDDVERLADTLSRAAEINAALADLPEKIRSVLDRKLSLEQERVSAMTSELHVTRLPRAAK